MKQLFKDVKFYHTARNYEEMSVCKIDDWKKLIEEIEKRIGKPEKGDVIYSENGNIPKQEISSLLKVKFTSDPKLATVFMISVPKCVSSEEYDDLWEQYYSDETGTISEPSDIISYNKYFKYKDGYSVEKMKTSKEEEHLIHLDDICYNVNEEVLNAISEKISKGEKVKVLNDPFFFEKYDEEIPEELFEKLVNMFQSNDKSFHKLGISIALGYSYKKNKAKITALFLAMNTDGDKTYNKMKDYVIRNVGYGYNHEESLIRAYLEHPTEAMSKMISKTLMSSLGVDMEGLKIKFEK